MPAAEGIKYEYHFCELDPERKGCKPGSRPECKELKNGLNCQHFKYRKEKENAYNP